MNARAARAAASAVHPPRPLPPRTTRAGTAKPSLAVVPETSTRSGRAPFVLLIVLVLSGGLAALLGFNTALAQGSFTASRLQKQATELDDRSQSLEEQLARAASPDRLARSARKLGMVPAPGVAFIQLSDGTITGATEPAPVAPRPLTAAEKAELAARQRAAAEQAAQEQAAKQERKARNQQKAAEEKAAADAAAAAAAQQAAAQQAEKQWQQKHKEQEQGGSRRGGEQVVDPPPGR
ncbi:MAG TPA: hypothetical protein VNC22_20030 [Sporichthya sp.]|nr:hypothetical protein [Sporichthya sp.]